MSRVVMCDATDCVRVVALENERFYTEGTKDWLIVAFMARAGDVPRDDTADRHFCSAECLISWCQISIRTRGNREAAPDHDRGRDA